MVNLFSPNRTGLILGSIPRMVSWERFVIHQSLQLCYNALCCLFYSSRAEPAAAPAAEAGVLAPHLPPRCSTVRVPERERGEGNRETGGRIWLAERKVGSDQNRYYQKICMTDPYRTLKVLFWTCNNYTVTKELEYVDFVPIFILVLVISPMHRHTGNAKVFVSPQEKLVLRERLWESREQLQQQAEFCTGLGAATCTVLWSASRREEAVRDILADVSHFNRGVCH